MVCDAVVVDQKHLTLQVFVYVRGNGEGVDETGSESLPPELNPSTKVSRLSSQGRLHGRRGKEKGGLRETKE
jgi:hypothetical protein